MALKSMPTFSATKLSMLEVPQPGVGGLNLYDLEYEQEVNQSPYMFNMMYRNGTFSKRYGQSVYSEYTGTVYALEYFDEKVIVHAGTNLYVDGTQFATGLPAVQGVFIKFYQTLLYYCNGTIYEYKYDASTSAWTWGTMEYYTPTCFINCEINKKGVSEGTFDRLDDLNILKSQYICEYDGDGTNTVLYAYGDDDDIINWSGTPVAEIKIDDTVTTAYTVDKTNKKVTFTSAPAEGSNNITVKWNLKSSVMQDDRTRLLACKYSINYGANGSSHLFLAGGGNGKLFYSDSYDCTYFPENNWIILGLTEDDITGFGLEYNVLIAFKQHAVYSLYSYNITASMVTSDDEDEIGAEAFGSQIVNAQIGCDAPYSIQLINNQLTWFSSKEGVCTLVSTNVSDERNIRVISRNVNHTNNLGFVGMLDIKLDNGTSLLDTVVSVDYDNKYFLCFPRNFAYDDTTSTYVESDYGRCFVWDYAIAPFVYTSSKVTDPKTLDWFVFDSVYARQFLNLGDKLVYACRKTGVRDNTTKYLILQFTDGFSDVDLTDLSNDVGISAKYRTPLLQLGAVEYLKTVKNIFIQCRADTATIIELKVITEENPDGETLDPIIIGKRLWKGFEWTTFTWSVVNFAKVFRRKVSLKKIKMVALELSNAEVNRDMSVSHMAFQYFVVKEVK